MAEVCSFPSFPVFQLLSFPASRRQRHVLRFSFGFWVAAFEFRLLALSTLRMRNLQMPALRIRNLENVINCGDTSRAISTTAFCCHSCFLFCSQQPYQSIHSHKCGLDTIYISTYIYIYIYVVCVWCYPRYRAEVIKKLWRRDRQTPAEALHFPGRRKI